MRDFEKFKGKLPCKEKFYSSLARKKVGDKEYEHVLKIWNTIQAGMFEKFRNNSIRNCAQ